MAEERLDLIKVGYNKIQYVKTIDTSFNELGTTTVTQDLIATPNIQEFFTMYNTLFYDIPALGENQSHQYLVRTSGNYINFDEISQEVAALQAEIAQLRADLLNAQMEVIQAQAGGSDDAETNAQLQQIQKELDEANQNIVETNTRSEELQSTSNNVGAVGGGLMEATQRLRRQGLKRGGGVCLRGMNREAIGKNS